jgi:murein L,D-transpeptidase YcbB/YkuD
LFHPASPLRRRNLLAALSALALLLAPDGRAREEAAESELLRTHVELIRDDPGFDVSGVPIAAKRVLPQLYARRGFTFAWTAPAAREGLLRAIRASAADGLDPEDYLLSPLERVRAEAEAEGASLDVQIHYDLLLSEALTRLLYHLIFGKVDPKRFDPNWNFARRVHLEDPAAYLQETIDSGDLFARLEREKPQHDLYRRLKAALAREREIAAAGGWQALPAGSTWKPASGAPPPDALRARLRASGDLAADAPPEASEVEAALKRFQARHGLDPDGVVGPATLAALNVPIGERIEAIRVNLERSRWLLHDIEPTFLVVNVAGFEVYYLRDQELVWSARAVVGRRYRKTPIFRALMTYLVLNPTWTVPPTILAQDILPEQRRDRSTLRRKGLEVIDHSGRPVPESSIDWANATPRNFRYLLRQPPGPDNALGRVKFVFPNPYTVFLHDTPSKALFERSERAFSSGCIRIENPLELAALVLEGQPGWDREAIDRAVATGATQTVTLARPLPVLVSYWTVWVDRDGVLQRRADIYGRDAKVAAGLAAGFRPRAPGS